MYVVRVLFFESFQGDFNFVFTKTQNFLSKISPPFFEFMNAIEGFLGFVEGIISWCFWENSFSFFGVISIKSRCPGVSWWGLERVYLIRSQRFVSSIGNMKHSIVSVCVP